MTEPRKNQIQKSQPGGEKPWYTQVYSWVSPSSHRDDWHPDVYRNFDPRQWVETIAATGLDVVFLQSKDHAGMAYYQTEIDHSHMGLKGKDFLGELLELFHQRGIRVVVNQSILFDNYLYNQHPDWRIRDADGNDSKTIFSEGLQSRGGIVCFNSPYHALAVAQVEALAKKYPIDGIFFDMLFAWIPVCYCQYCKKKYRDECDSDFPEKTDRFSPAFRGYVHWRNQKLYDFTRDLVKAFKTYRPDGMATFNSPRPHADRPSGLDRAHLADILSGDPTHGTWSGLPISFACNTWSNMTRYQPARMDLGRMHGMEGQHTGMRSYDELMLSAAICMANNCGIEFIEVVNADGTLYASPYRTYKKIFDTMRPLIPYLGGEKLRSVAVYISAETKEYLYETNPEQLFSRFGKVRESEAAWQYTSNLEETFRAFLEHHIPVDLITRLNLEELDRYSLLFLPDALCMSETEAERIRAYVRNGGKVVAMRYTSLADEDGNLRNNFALSDVFGVDYLGETENNETFMQIPPELCQQANIPEDMEVKVDKQAIVQAKPGSTTIGTILLPYTNRENDSQRWVGIWDTPAGMATDHPVVVMNRYGKGQSCYFSARIHNLNPVFSPVEGRALMYTLARSLLDIIPFIVEGPSWVIATAYRQPEEKRLLVHLVNAPQDVPVTSISNIKVKLQLQEGEKVSAVLIQPDQAKLDYQESGRSVSFGVPRIDLYQIIEIDFL